MEQEIKHNFIHLIHRHVDTCHFRLEVRKIGLVSTAPDVIVTITKYKCTDQLVSGRGDLTSSIITAPQITRTRLLWSGAMVEASNNNCDTRVSFHPWLKICYKNKVFRHSSLALSLSINDWMLSNWNERVQCAMNFKTGHGNCWMKAYNIEMSNWICYLWS